MVKGIGSPNFYARFRKRLDRERRERGYLNPRTGDELRKTCELRNLARICEMMLAHVNCSDLYLTPEELTAIQVAQRVLHVVELRYDVALEGGSEDGRKRRPSARQRR